MKPVNDNGRFIAPKDAATMTSLSRPMLSLLSQRGEFPKPIPLTGGRRIAYLRTEVEAWIDQRIAARAAA